MLRSVAAPLLLAGAAAAAGAGPRITLESRVIRVHPAAPSSTLEVFVDGPAGLPPLLGATERRGDVLLFTPRFALQPGMRYRAVYRESDRAAPFTEVLALAPAPVPPATRVERIDPTPDVVPENLLKLYL